MYKDITLLDAARSLMYFLDQDTEATIKLPEKLMHRVNVELKKSWDDAGLKVIPEEGFLEDTTTPMLMTVPNDSLLTIEHDPSNDKITLTITKK